MAEEANAENRQVGYLIALGVLGLAFIALAVFTVVRTSSLSSQIDEANSSIDGVSGEVKTVANEVGEVSEESSGAQQQSATEQEEALKQLTVKLRKLETCVPEMQTELSSEKVEEVGYAEITSQVSSYCSEIVYGDGG